MDAWRHGVHALAAYDNVVAKVSGLELPGVPFTAEALRPAWDAAYEAFGPDRLMYGGDWPVTSRAGDYAHVFAVMSDLIALLPPSEQDAVYAGNAERVYRLAARSD